MPVNQRRPDLDHCVQVLQSIARDLSPKPPKSVGDLYVAAVGLLYHLKIDQGTLLDIRKQHEGKENIPFPQSNAIPAITAVVHNQILFKALISCLSSSATDMEAVDSRPHMPLGRKRAASMGEPPESAGSKLLKVSHSPQISKRSVAYARPQLNVKVLASTILFIAFEYLDHWPVPLVKAYAEDSFGPRNWVDDPACQLLVRNIALCHDGNDDSGPEDVEKEADALIVADFYQEKQDDNINVNLPNASSNRQKKRGSLSSQSSQASLMGSVNPTRPRSMSTDSASIDHTLSPNKPQPSRKRSIDEYHSDSGDEEEVAVAVSGAPTKKSDDGDSSSSGEEDEEVLVATKSVDEESVSQTSPNSNDVDLPPSVKPTYPVRQQFCRFQRIRRRYFGINLEFAHGAISSSLNERLEVKSKQNSSLLQALPNFTSVPSVRTLITGNLEKWLQSPALAGLARALFAQTVSMMKNVDPPLPADLEAIRNILTMRLKANQLNAHVENVTAIATRIPTAAVSYHIYRQLLREVLLALEKPDSSASDSLKMIQAVHNAIPSQLSAQGISAALLKMLQKSSDQSLDIEMSHLVRKLRTLMKSIAKELGTAFDWYELLQCMLQNSENSSWTKEESENLARLLYQCTTLLVRNPSTPETQLPQSRSSAETSANDLESLKPKLLMARKALLSWCCSNYAPLCSVNADGRIRSNGNASKDGEIGAGPADFKSILDGVNSRDVPEWLSVMRSVLFMEGSDSSHLRRFLNPSGGADIETEWEAEALRIDSCCTLGADLDDEMVWIVLRAAGENQAGTPCDVALQLLEHLFECCNKDKKAQMKVSDPKILWELYKLVEYIPSTCDDQQARESSKVEKTENTLSKGTGGVTLNGSGKGRNLHGKLGRLAYPGMWWRATCLALIMCGSSPETIGSVAWEMHPTLRALVKMVTSDRYRFPTVDCDDKDREEVKRTEQSMRDEEAKITEELFLPNKNLKKTSDAKITESSYGGSRVSKRQREKRERELKKRKEKEAKEAAKEASRRKKMLRAAQKSIMLWDPTRGPRKPPKESVDLIFSVGELFDLPRVFQRSLKPDFLLMTIGNTSRDAIERAYDWLIPIISFVPGAISRLPASASCFLLLRAYVTEGEERAQLQELSAPLLIHVRESLTGKFGEEDAVRAFDLLLTDVASHNPDRRRCARRVLHDAIGKSEACEISPPFLNSNCAWMINMLNVKYVASILDDAIKYMTRAASFERGRVLRFIVLALEKLSEAARDKKYDLDCSFDFPSVLIGLISNRPTVFGATMGAFHDLRSLAIRVVHGEFIAYAKRSSDSDHGLDLDAAVKMSMRSSLLDTEESKFVTLPLPLLQSSCVILSIWLENEDDGGDSQAVDNLVHMLMRSEEGDGDDDCGDLESMDGLVSAQFCVSGKKAVPVESWVMLARSRSDFIAKRAALTAPTGFLPRLLLCSGLPRASLFTMIDRLGKLGDKSADREKTFNQLLVPSAASEWDIGRLGRRYDVARKLLGRLSAYSKMFELSKPEARDSISFTFLHWLSESCTNHEKPRKTKNKKAKSTPPPGLADTLHAETILARLPGDFVESSLRSKVQLDGDESDMTRFALNCLASELGTPESATDANEVERFINRVFNLDQIGALEVWLSKNFGDPLIELGRNGENDIGSMVSRETLSCVLLKTFSELDRKTELLGASLVKWVPKLSASNGSPDLWEILFAEGQKPTFMWSTLVARCCQSWSHHHVTCCRDWILNSSRCEELDLEKVVRFLIHSSSFPGIHIESFAETPIAPDDADWMNKEELVTKASKVAISCLSSLDEDSHPICDRNEPPDSIVLLLLISRHGKRQLQCVCQHIVEEVEKGEGECRMALLATLLRLYAYFPQSMNLGVAVLRKLLKEAVEQFGKDWLTWRSPLDDQFEDIIVSMFTSVAPSRLTQALAEGAKRHPLLLLRKLESIETGLEEDAIACEMTVANENRGVLYGKSLSGPMPAKVDHKLIQVSVKHWGYNFTENIWIAFLDIMKVMPNEVLYSCGLKAGLLDFLGVYLRLVFVQSQLRTSERLQRLKEKLATFYREFKVANPLAWEVFLSKPIKGLPTLGGARNVLMSCDFISHQEAIDNVKTSHGSAKSQA